MKVSKIWGAFNKIKRSVFVRYTNYIQRKKIRQKIKEGNCKTLTKKQIAEASEYFKSFGIKGIKPFWHQYYTELNGHYSKKFIPDNYFKTTIAYALNNKAYRSLMDKNLLNKLFTNIEHPGTVIKKINGFYQHNDMIINKEDAVEICKDHDKLIIKPSVYSGGGKDIIVFSTNGDTTSYKNWSVEEIFDQYGKNFIVQKFVNQHKLLRSLNESSLNTLRVHSYLSGERVHILSCFLRIGSKGSVVDNMSSGGIGCGVNSDGTLQEVGYHNNLVDTTTQTDTGIILEGIKVPCYDAILEKVKMLHHQVPFFQIVAWDLTVDDNDAIVLIEYNLWEQAIDFPQLLHGPLFGEFTDEVLKTAVKYDKVNSFY